MKRGMLSRKAWFLFFILALPFLAAFRTNIGFWQSSCPIRGGKAIYNDGHDYVEASCDYSVSPPTLMFKYYPLVVANTCGYGIASKGYKYRCSGPGAAWNGGGCSAGGLICNNMSTAFTRYPDSSPPQDFAFGTSKTEGTFYTNSGNRNDYGDTCVSYNGKRTLTLYQCGDYPNYAKACPQGYVLQTTRSKYKSGDTTRTRSSLSCVGGLVSVSSPPTKNPVYYGSESCVGSGRHRKCSCRVPGTFVLSSACYECPSGSSWDGYACIVGGCPSGSFACSLGCCTCLSPGTFNGTTCTAPLNKGMFINLSW